MSWDTSECFVTYVVFMLIFLNSLNIMLMISKAVVLTSLGRMCDLICGNMVVFFTHKNAIKVINGGNKYRLEHVRKKCGLYPSLNRHLCSHRKC